MARKKTTFDFGESIDYTEDVEDGFSENTEPIGKVLESFSFVSQHLAAQVELPHKIPDMVPDKLIDNRTLQTKSYGITPPVHGEFFQVRRTFMFRRSTVRMLNKLKAEHENENIYLSSIVDEAIRVYYEQVLGEGKS